MKTLQQTANFAKMCKEVTEIANQARKAGQKIEVNKPYSFVCIEDPENETEYTFQGEEADNLIEEAEGSKLSDYCTVEDILLWMSQGW